MTYALRKKVTTTVYLEPEQKAALDELATATRVQMAVYLREGADMVLAKYAKEIRKYRRAKK